jgi:hypothetical protein
MLEKLSVWFCRLPRWAKIPFEWVWYASLSAFDRGADLVFMNYGWAGEEGSAGALPLLPEDEPNRYCIQLYGCVLLLASLRG